jgi:DNA-binding transcriptional LysR family regulator
MPDIDALTDKVKRMKSESLETLFTGAVESIHLGDAAKNAVVTFVSKAKDVELYIERYGFDTLHNKVIDGSLDAAFTISTRIGKMKDIVYTEIEQREKYIIMSSDHRLTAQNEIKVEDLRDETIVLHGSSGSMVLCEDLIDECRKHGFIPNIRYAPDINSLLDYLELTGGITFLDKSITENRPGRLKYFPIDIKKPFSLICIWRKKNKNPALQEFLKHLPNSANVKDAESIPV